MGRQPVSGKVRAGGSGADGLGPDALRRWLVELSRPNADEWRRVRVEEPRLRRATATRDPVLLALREEAIAREPVGGPEQRFRLSPAHAYWLDRTATEPLAFARHVIEATRRDSLLRPARGSSAEALALLDEPGLSEIDGEGVRRLRALATVYLADDHRHLRRLRAAEERLEEARKLLGEGPGEMAATLFQVEADLLRDCGAIAAARRRLDEAAERLADCPIPGRWSELQLQRGRLHLVEQDGFLARPLLRDALRRLPDDLAHHFRLEMLHCLAAADLSAGDFDAAALHLDEAGKYQGFGHAGLFPQRQWMLGQVALHRSQYDEAHGHLLEALEILLAQGQKADAVHVLTDLLTAANHRGELGAVLNASWEMILQLEAGEQDAVTHSRLRRLRQRLASMQVDSEALGGILGVSEGSVN